jgi:hypothetical protein
VWGHEHSDSDAVTRGKMAGGARGLEEGGGGSPQWQPKYVPTGKDLCGRPRWPRRSSPSPWRGRWESAGGAELGDASGGGATGGGGVAGDGGAADGGGLAGGWALVGGGTRDLDGGEHDRRRWVHFLVGRG